MGIRVEGASIDLGRTIAWKDGIVGKLTGGVSGLLQKARVKIVHGRAHFRDGKTVEVETEIGQQIIRAETVVIATGSDPVELANLPFGGRVISSTEALSLTELPKKLVVVGGGYIGLELGTAFSKMGSDVTIVEATPQVLPQYDAELVRPVMRKLTEGGIRVLTGAKAIGLADNGEVLIVETADGRQQSPLRRTASSSPSAAAQEPQDPVSKSSISTVLKPLFEDRRPLPHVDARHLCDRRCDRRADACPSGHGARGDGGGNHRREEAGLGQTMHPSHLLHRSGNRQRQACRKAEAKAQGYEIRTGQFPFSANGRAMTMLSEEGFVRVVARADTNLVLGLQAVGAGVSELSAAFALAIEMGARLEDIAGTIHAHPTRSEAVMEAALKALGSALHI